MSSIRAKDRDALIQSLRAGVVPRVGQYLIQVGREKELQAVIKDIERVADGGTMFRLVIGEFGSGKTFFLNLVRSVALEKKIVTAHVDLNPDRRLHATGGQARSLFNELMKNLSTRTKPEGGAISGIIERFIANAKLEATQKGKEPGYVIHEKLVELSELVNGYEFANVISKYWEGAEIGQEQLKLDAIRWLRGEFTTKTEAKNALGVRAIIDDSSIYDQLKLLSKFVRLSGYNGLVVYLDEMVNLYKLSNTQARNANYEQILRILNDTLQGNNEGLGFVLGGTPEFLLDTRRGLYSYPALQTRLEENTFARQGLVDFQHPVLRLSSLTQEEFLVLLEKLQNVYVNGKESQCLIAHEGLVAFMEHCNKQIGDCYFRTPRKTIVTFVNLLSVLEQNVGLDWREIIGTSIIERDEIPLQDGVVHEYYESNVSESNPNTGVEQDEFTTFKL